MPKFIFSECPRPQKNCQFLQMILEHKVKVVVLLSPEKEIEEKDSGYDLVPLKSWLPSQDTKYSIYEKIEVRASRRRILKNTNNGEERTVSFKGWYNNTKVIPIDPNLLLAV